MSVSVSVSVSMSVIRICGLPHCVNQGAGFQLFQKTRRRRKARDIVEPSSVGGTSSGGSCTLWVGHPPVLVPHCSSSTSSSSSSFCCPPFRSAETQTIGRTPGARQDRRQIHAWHWSCGSALIADWVEYGTVIRWIPTQGAEVLPSEPHSATRAGWAQFKIASCTAAHPREERKRLCSALSTLARYCHFFIIVMHLMGPQVTVNCCTRRAPGPSTGGTRSQSRVAVLLDANNYCVTSNGLTIPPTPLSPGHCSRPASSILRWVSP